MISFSLRISFSLKISFSLWISFSPTISFSLTISFSQRISFFLCSVAFTVHIIHAEHSSSPHPWNQMPRSLNFLSIASISTSHITSACPISVPLSCQTFLTLVHWASPIPYWVISLRLPPQCLRSWSPGQEAAPGDLSLCPLSWRSSVYVDIVSTFLEYLAPGCLVFVHGFSVHSRLPGRKMLECCFQRGISGNIE